MKKLLLILFTLNLLLCSCGKEKEFDENLTVAFTEMQKMWNLSTNTYDDIHKTVMDLLVNKVLMSDVDSPDLKKEMEELSDSLIKAGVKDSIELYKKNFNEAFDKLSEPPSSRKDCYDEFADLIVEFRSFCRKYFEHTESNFLNKSEFEKEEEAFMTKVDKFQFKYGKYLKIEE